MFYKGKKVLVTGGSGFVGTHIVEALLKQEAKVRVPLHSRPMIIKDPRIETMSADLTSLQDCLKVLEGVDCVFHAAGAVSAAGVTARNPMSAITTNLILTARMLEASCATGVDRFLVFGSSTGYPPADYPIKEDEMWNGPTYPVYFGYGWMRRYLERLAEFTASKSKLQIAILRPTATYGRWDDFDPVTSHVIPGLIRRAVQKENPYVVWGTGHEVRDFLHVTDLAKACLLLLEKHPFCDPVNIGLGLSITIKEVVGYILEFTGYKDATIQFDSTKPSTIPFRMVDTTKATNILGFEPSVSFRQGIKDTVEWYLKTYSRKI